MGWLVAAHCGSRRRVAGVAEAQWCGQGGARHVAPAPSLVPPALPPPAHARRRRWRAAT